MKWVLFGLYAIMAAMDFFTAFQCKKAQNSQTAIERFITGGLCIACGIWLLAAM